MGGVGCGWGVRVGGWCEGGGVVWGWGYGVRVGGVM